MSTTHASVTLDLDADIVEFCQHDSFPEVLAVGTYTLQESTKERIGKLYLFEVATSLDNSSSTGLKELTHHDTEAIFDLSWAPFEKHNSDGSTAALLAQAGASGNVEVYSVSRDAAPSDVGDLDHSDDPAVGALQLDQVQKVKCSFEGGLCTSVDWSHPDTSPSTFIATSTSACELVVLDAAAPGKMETIVHLPGAHNLEIWNVAFDRWHPMLLFSGADDCGFKGWDLRIAGRNMADSALDGTFTNYRMHNAGVCCVVPSPWEEFKVFTGSYDQSIRLWDTRALNRPVVQTELKTEGGVWRIKCHPTKPGTIAAACMYGGFFVMDGFFFGGEPTVVEEYVGSHDKAKIAYGVDWYKGKNSSQSLAASCSFYDRVLNLWSPSE